MLVVYICCFISVLWKEYDLNFFAWKNIIDVWCLFVARYVWIESVCQHQLYSDCHFNSQQLLSRHSYIVTETNYITIKLAHKTTQSTLYNYAATNINNKHQEQQSLFVLYSDWSCAFSVCFASNCFLPFIINGIIFQESLRPKY